MSSHISQRLLNLSIFKIVKRSCFSSPITLDFSKFQKCSTRYTKNKYRTATLKDMSMSLIFRYNFLMRKIEIMELLFIFEHNKAIKEQLISIWIKLKHQWLFLEDTLTNFILLFVSSLISSKNILFSKLPFCVGYSMKKQKSWLWESGKWEIGIIIFLWRAKMKIIHYKSSAL